MATGEFEVMTLEADEDEHSIEVSLAAQLVEECEVPTGEPGNEAHPLYCTSGLY